MTSDTIIIAIIAATPGTLVGIASLIASLRNTGKIEEVKKATDGMKDQLVAAAKKEGASEEKQDEKERKALVAETLAAAGPSEVKIVNPTSEPVPTITADAKQEESDEPERKSYEAKPTEKLKP